ncbi:MULTISPECIES: CE1759 family FMN reductase [Streptomyces]|uniref:CE1759 family FMN reductase n=1 Tax=Streptomyces TaxID=1883 RepID=UPI000F7A2C0B|nr:MULTISPECIES: CE1759 family FMN reductase [Streptomyces]RST04516.1 hydroxymethylpyrimidine ABC transporter substrate-binding protein [Streptomyces sp. WAC07149]GLX21474.1 oxidoreductase [Streptomyces lavendulae subsp. lavendulae]GLX28891.1 oxidoreductase [Streptomyces lavendulae subsp. lavendulae]
MKLVVVSAGLSAPSSTRLLADRLAAATLAHVDARTEVIELRDLATEIAQHLVTGFPPVRLAAALDAVAAADGLIAVTPVFAASYSGLFKSFFDLIDKDALTGKPVLLGATGGTARHSLVTEHAMRPLFTHLRALVLPTAVYAASEDWGGEGLERRIARAGAELARFAAPAAGAAAPDVGTAAAIAPRSLTGAITSVDPADGFTVVPFEQRLAALRAG